MEAEGTKVLMSSNARPLITANIRREHLSARSKIPAVSGGRRAASGLSTIGHRVPSKSLAISILSLLSSSESTSSSIDRQCFTLRLRQRSDLPARSPGTTQHYRKCRLTSAESYRPNDIRYWRQRSTAYDSSCGGVPRQAY